MERRSDILVEQALRLLPDDRKTRNILLVGALGSLLSRLVKLPDVAVAATDDDSEVVGRDYHGVRVQPQTLTLDLLRAAKVAIITGMVLSNGTVDHILDMATASSTRVIMYLQTGAHLVVPYLSAGVSVVVSEAYPFYFVAPGETAVRVYRATDTIA